ncbi:MAG: hypothetical protein WAT79_00165 [Saprospiraceae bacterium]
MNIQLRNLVFVSILVFLGITANAQSRNIPLLVTVGPTTTFLDNGLGLHFGLNPSYVLFPRFSLEGQVSYLHTSIGSSFLSGERGSINAFSTMAGGRLYLNNDSEKIRYYINILVGWNYFREKIDGVKKDGEYGFGYGGGAYVELNRLVLGLSSESPQNLVLKLGYSF